MKTDSNKGKVFPLFSENKRSDKMESTVQSYFDLVESEQLQFKKESEKKILEIRKKAAGEVTAEENACDEKILKHGIERTKELCKKLDGDHKKVVEQKVKNAENELEQLLKRMENQAKAKDLAESLLKAKI